MSKKKDMPPSGTGHRVRRYESGPVLCAGAFRRNRSAQPQSRDFPKAIPIAWSKADKLAIQLMLDPHVTALEFRTSLLFAGREVPVEMFVADLDDGGRVAFDIIDERPYRDLDTEGLLLLALECHGIGIIELDHASIEAEPRASNTCRLWGHREHEVPADLREAINRALASRRRLTIRSLANVVRLHDPMPTIGALVSRGVLAIDLSRPLGFHSVVGRRSDRWPAARRPNWFGKDSQ
jgi:hypothetical protein